MSGPSDHQVLRLLLVASSADRGAPFLRCCRLTVAVAVEVCNKLYAIIIIIMLFDLHKIL